MMDGIEDSVQDEAEDEKNSVERGSAMSLGLNQHRGKSQLDGGCK
jgi:hypothetical protein